MQVAWIETFLTVVERGGFCAAADSLFRSQSRVSAHIASLELELGARLLDRSQRPVALTAAGQAFFDYAASAKLSLDAGAAAVRAVEERREARIVLGADAATGASFLPPLLADLAHDRRDLRVDIVEQPAARLDKALLEGTIDVAIRPRLPRLAHSGISRESLWSEGLVAVVPHGHALAHAPHVHLAELIDAPLITSDEIVATLREASFEPNVALVSAHPLTLIGCVARGLGIGLTSESALHTVPTDGAVVVEIADPIERVVDVCWIAESSSTRALLEAMRRARVPVQAPSPARATERVLRLVKPAANPLPFAAQQALNASTRGGTVVHNR